MSNEPSYEHMMPVLMTVLKKLCFDKVYFPDKCFEKILKIFKIILNLLIGVKRCRNVKNKMYIVP